MLLMSQIQSSSLHAGTHEFNVVCFKVLGYFVCAGETYNIIKVWCGEDMQWQRKAVNVQSRRK
jgi:hypothetical protein